MEFGKNFEDKRTGLGVSLEQIEEDTKIRKLYLEAIEQERFNVLPPRVYATGFVKKYARYLGLDEKGLVAQFTELAYAHDEPEQVIKEDIPQPAFRFEWRNLVTAGVFLVVVLWAGTWVVGAITRQTTDNMAGKPPVQQPANQTGSSVGEQNRSQASNPAKQGQMANVRIEAKSDCWIKAIVDGQTVFANILPAGQEKSFEGNDAVLLTVGNAGGIEIYYNGERMEPLGKAGEVIQREFRVARLGS